MDVYREEKIIMQQRQIRNMSVFLPFNFSQYSLGLCIASLVSLLFSGSACFFLFVLFSFFLLLFSIFVFVFSFLFASWIFLLSFVLFKFFFFRFEFCFPVFKFLILFLVLLIQS